MTYSIPQPKHLRTVELIEIYEFYDKPVLFSCVDETNNIFIVVLIEESNEYDMWLYAPISKGRFNQIRSGQIDLHDTFAKVENRVVYEVQIPYIDTLKESFRQIDVNSIEGDILPMPGEYININTPLNLPKSRLNEALQFPQNPFHLDSEKMAQRMKDIIPHSTNLPVHYPEKKPPKKRGSNKRYQ